jgi:hypothetical protein
MYPAGELARLSTQKALLQARIAVKRWECVAAGAELARPLAIIDRGIALWRKISPWVKLAGFPAALLVMRTTMKSKGTGKFSKALAALPVVLKTWRMVQHARAAAR